MAALLRLGSVELRSRVVSRTRPSGQATHKSGGGIHYYTPHAHFVGANFLRHAKKFFRSGYNTVRSMYNTEPPQVNVLTNQNHPISLFNLGSAPVRVLARMACKRLSESDNAPLHPPARTGQTSTSAKLHSWQIYSLQVQDLQVAIRTTRSCDPNGTRRAPQN